MKKKGFTLIELTIAITLIAIIAAACSALFAVTFKNYQTQNQRQLFMKNLNFSTDEMNRDIKQAVEVPISYDVFTTDATHLVLGLPAVDSFGNFIYNGGVLQEDYIVYYLNGTDLIRKTYSQNGSQRVGQNGIEKTILSDVSTFSATYTPGGVPRQVTVSASLSRVVSKVNVTVSATTTADLRNNR